MTLWSTREQEFSPEKSSTAIDPACFLSAPSMIINKLWYKDRNLYHNKNKIKERNLI